MCGIAGLWTPAAAPDAATVVAMLAALRHRGPDSEGCWGDAPAGLQLGHRRLAIVDLSPSGHQPMQSASGRHVLCFNGEIYNHEALRRAVGRQDWRGSSDTESLLAAIDCWGLETALRRAVGMFALALWDRERGTLSLARDRFGEKPLYAAWVGGGLAFASEAKAFRAVAGFVPRIRRDVLAAYLRYGFVPEPVSLLDGVFKVPPGQVLNIDVDALRHGALPAPVPYWSVDEGLRLARAEPARLDDDAAADALDRVLREAVAGQMVADVPLGAFLSGGIDSSLVTALMQAQSDRPVRTFTIGFRERAYDESAHAAAVARHLGTEHTELVLGIDEACSLVPSLPTIWCEPFGDASQLPTLLVSRLAREHVTVALSGDAGDELFGGYNRHVAATGAWPRLQRVPRSLRCAAAAAVLAVPPARLDAVHGVFSPLLPRRLQARLAGHKLHKAAGILGARDTADLHQRLLSIWPPEVSLVPGSADPRRLLPRWPEAASPAEAMMAMDLLTYLPGDILVKVDRAAMSVSLETRTPFLDHRVAELAWRLPLRQKIRDGRGKWLPRRLLGRYVPPALTERPKMGFGVPIGDWLRGPLRTWAEALLATERLAEGGLLDPAPIRACWDEHLAGRRDGQYALWNVLMFQAWREHWPEAR